MKKIGDLMAEMGFNSQAPLDVQKSFIKYLGRVSQKNQAILQELESTEPDQWVEVQLKQNQPSPLPDPVQLAFDFGDRPKAG